MMAATCHGCDAKLPPSRSNRPRKWCSTRCRKASYGDPCVDCGARTIYGAETKRIAEPRCAPCAREHFRVWTRDLILDRIREWATLYGEPPAAPDWNPYQARHDLHDEARARRYEDAEGHWPPHTTVFRLIGSWSGAIEAAGFAARPPHGGGENVERRQRRSRRMAEAA